MNLNDVTLINLQEGFKHTVLVCKLKDDSMKSDFENDLIKFFSNLGEEEGEFQQKCTGYCIVYAPYCIHFIETDDEEFLDMVLKEINSSIGVTTHEQAWMIFQTEEVPERAFHEWYCKGFTASSSQKEIKQLPMLEKIHSMYTAMLGVGQTVTQVLEKGKGVI